MSECVVRMEMPRNCYNCDLRYECNAFYAPGKPKPFMKGCQIICQLPEGHGRIIDADEFLKRAIGTKCFPEDDSRMLQGLVGESITIVPAEPPKEEENDNNKM